MHTFIVNKLIEEFKDREAFSREELFNFFRSFEPDLKEGTLGWRIYDLKKKNILRTVRRGHYAISSKPVYKPMLSYDLLKLAKRISEQFKEITYCIWETEWLNEFTVHQTGKKMIIIEIETDMVDSLFYDLKDHLKYDFFIDPNDKAIEYYIPESNKPVIIKNLLTRAPITSRTEKQKTIHLPLLEKILVDLFAERKLFYFYQGNELVNIYNSALNHYALNFTKIFHYAKRRDKAQEIKDFMLKNMPHLTKGFIANDKK